MEKKVAAAIGICGIALAFGAVSVLVILSKRHPFFVEKKLRLGALLLSLSGVLAACGSGPLFPGTVMCYDSVPYDYISINRIDYSSGELTVSKSDTISGTIDQRRGSQYSFSLTDSAGTQYYRNDIFSEDGAFDETSEEFRIGFPESIAPGSYILRFYNTPKDSIPNAESYMYIREFNIILTE